MLKRLSTSVGALAALAALALGGSAIATAHAGHAKAKATHVAKHHRVHSAAEPVTGRDTDNVQSGDQTTPDAGTSAAEQSSRETVPGSEAATPETGAGASDGPGGHQDPAGANVDHQAQGQE